MKTLQGLAIALFAFSSSLATAQAPEPITPPTPPEPPAIEEIEIRLRDAQKRMEEAVRDVTRYSTQYYTKHAPDIHSLLISTVGKSKGAMLGVHIEDIHDGEDKKLDGVKIVGLTPNGPAEKAGLQNGDRIKALNGERLQWSDDTSPVQHLLSIMSKIEPEQPVAVDYERDGKTNSVVVDTKQLEMHRWTANGDSFDFDLDFDFDIERDEHGNYTLSEDKRRLLENSQRQLNDKIIVLKDRISGFSRQFRRPWHDLELLTLNAKLGRYFDTDKGLLVVGINGNQDLGLEEGDVILNIDGREPKDPAHAIHILNSYQTGEVAKLNILREKRQRTIEIEVENHQKDVKYQHVDEDIHRPMTIREDRVYPTAKRLKIEKRDSI